MVTKRERRPSKSAAAKKAAAKKRAEGNKNSNTQKVLDSLAAQAEADRSNRSKNPNPAGVGTAAGPEKGQKPTAPKPGVAAKAVSKGDPNYPKAPDRTKTSEPGDATAPSGLLAGLTTGIPDDVDKAGIRAKMAAREKHPISNPKLYAHSTAQSAAALADRITAMNTAIQQQKTKGNAVYMGIDPDAPLETFRRQGPQRMDEFGGTTEKQKARELILTKDELLSWLSDEAKVAQIKTAAEKAGYTIQSYDDVSKLWTAVVSQAASSYSLSNKKVTPWALLTLRGKYLVNGRPADKVTTSTNIDEMDPAQARLMFEQTAQQALGRAPTKSEVDDFIAKAQTIAKQNPGVTTTTHHMGVDGTEDSQDSRTVGGQDVVNAKAQVAAMDSARQSEDYQAYQAAGNYFPMLFEALSSPV